MRDLFACSRADGCRLCAQLLWRIDQGEAVQIAGVPDAVLRQQLGDMFLALHLAKTSKVLCAHHAAWQAYVQDLHACRGMCPNVNCLDPWRRAFTQDVPGRCPPSRSWAL